MKTFNYLGLACSLAVACALPRHRQHPHVSARQQDDVMQIPTLPPDFGLRIPSWPPNFGMRIPTLPPSFGMQMPTLPPTFDIPMTRFPGFGRSLPPYLSFSLPNAMPGSLPPFPMPSYNGGNGQKHPTRARGPVIQPFQSDGNTQSVDEMPWQPWSFPPGQGSNNRRRPGISSPSPFVVFSNMQTRPRDRVSFSWTPPSPFGSNTDGNIRGVPGFGSPPPSLSDRSDASQRPSVIRTPPPLFRSTFHSPSTLLNGLRSSSPFPFMDIKEKR